MTRGFPQSTLVNPYLGTSALGQSIIDAPPVPHLTARTRGGVPAEGSRKEYDRKAVRVDKHNNPSV
jgi:hypothetical protein